LATFHLKPPEGDHHRLFLSQGDGGNGRGSGYPGLEHMIIHGAKSMPPKECKEQLTWFAKEGMPAFQR